MDWMSGVRFSEERIFLSYTPSFRAVGTNERPILWDQGEAEVWSWPLTSIYSRHLECDQCYIYSPFTPFWCGACRTNTPRFIFLLFQFINDDFSSSYFIYCRMWRWQWVMNWKGCGRKRLWTISGNSWKEPLQNSVRIHGRNLNPRYP
jgi:hypothetical protein